MSLKLRFASFSSDDAILRTTPDACRTLEPRFQNPSLHFISGCCPSHKVKIFTVEKKNTNISILFSNFQTEKVRNNWILRKNIFGNHEDEGSGLRLESCIIQMACKKLIIKVNKILTFWGLENWSFQLTMFRIVLVFSILLNVASGLEFWDLVGQLFDSNPESKADPTIDVSNSTYNYLVAGTLIVGGVVFVVAALFWIDIYATARIDEVIFKDSN